MTYLPSSPMKGRTLYEQIRILARQHGWPDNQAHIASNFAVEIVDGDNSPCKTKEELLSIAREALRTDLIFDN